MDQAFALGKAAVEFAVGGASVMPTIGVCLRPPTSGASARRPSDGWLIARKRCRADSSQNGFGVTAAGRAYFEPLIAGKPTLPTKGYALHSLEESLGAKTLHPMVRLIDRQRRLTYSATASVNADIARQR